MKIDTLVRKPKHHFLSLSYFFVYFFFSFFNFQRMTLDSGKPQGILLFYLSWKNETDGMHMSSLVLLARQVLCIILVSLLYNI